MTAKGAAFRLSCYYAALFTAVGIHLPFWPTWLSAKGLSASDIGWITAATYLVKVLVNPLVGHVVDRRGDQRLPMVVLSASAALAWLGFSLVEGFTQILLMTVVAIGLWTGLMPTGESLAMGITQQYRLDYGRIRLWGSVAFILAAAATGSLLVDASPSVLVGAISACLLVTSLACTGVPRGEPLPQTSGQPRLSIMSLLKNPLFLLFLCVTSLNQASHTVYYAFSTLHWQSAGIDNRIIAALWAEGVIAEIILFAFSAALLRRMGPRGLLLLAVLAGVVRWSVLGLTTALPALIAVQMLHAATFGCAHLGAMHFIQRVAAREISARAQSVYAAVALGVAPGMMSPLTGKLYGGLGGNAFWVMAGMSGAGCLLVFLYRRRMG